MRVSLIFKISVSATRICDIFAVPYCTVLQLNTARKIHQPVTEEKVL